MYLSGTVLRTVYHGILGDRPRRICTNDPGVGSGRSSYRGPDDDEVVAPKTKVDSSRRRDQPLVSKIHTGPQTGL